MHVHVESEADTILVALHHTTFGISTLCSSNNPSDSRSIVPVLELTKAGSYEIYIGTLEKDESQATSYNLYISELQP